AIRVLNESSFEKQNAPRPAGHEAHVSTLTNRHTFCFRSVKRAFVCDPRSFFANRARSSHSHLSFGVIAREGLPLAQRARRPRWRATQYAAANRFARDYWVTRLRGATRRLRVMTPWGGFHDTPKTKRPGGCPRRNTQR